MDIPNDWKNYIGNGPPSGTVKLVFPVPILVRAIRGDGITPLQGPISFRIGGHEYGPFKEGEFSIPIMIPGKMEIEITRGVFLCGDIACL